MTPPISRESRSYPLVQRSSVWGIGVYVNTAPYRYFALQVGPWFITLWSERARG